MSEKYRSFLAIVGFTIFWFIVILMCLSETDDDSRWTAAKLSWNVQPEGHIDSVNNNKLHANYQFQPPRSQAFMKYFQANYRDYSKLDVLNHQFNPVFSDDKDIVTKTISQDKHEESTRALGDVHTLTDRFVKSEGDKLFAFNLLVSNRIGPYRPIPDTRHAKCSAANSSPSHTSLDKSLSTNQPSVKMDTATKLRLKTSIIICYFNEAPSALLRTITTVLMRSPVQYIHEIIVVDDHSSSEYQADNIRPFFESNLVKLVRTSKREGLIRARLFGASLARGDILVFLDSHVEANVGWLEPLIEVIESNKTTIACPIIDLINADTLIYTASPMVKGGLNWALNFKWDSVPSDKLKTYDDFIKPIESPTMAGGLFAIHREFFYYLGSYDADMELWGGENIELSLRTWMCGGRILILPCSRLGHIFRKKRPYGPEPNQPDSLLYNSCRTAKVWLDGYIDKFYEANPNAEFIASGDVAQRIELRQSLGCQNFTWYLENVYPNLLNVAKEKSATHDKPKLFNPLNSKRVDRSIDSQPNNLNTIRSNMANSRRQRQISSHSMMEKFKARSFEAGQHSRGDLAMNMNSIQGHFPKLISKFQIQASGSDFCIESTGGFIAKRFARLVLNHCAKIASDPKLLSSNYTVLDQLWSESELHDYRIGDKQCLDLVKNLPLLRQCHNMGSFQEWITYAHNSGGTYIYNSGGGLCLGVERLQVGEPIIVTICDKKQHSNQDPVQQQHSHKLFSNWQSLQVPNRKIKNLAARFTQPFQRWNLITVNNLTTHGVVTS